MSRLQHFPITLFAATMGLAGLASAWRRSLTVNHLDLTPSVVLAIIAGAVFAITAVFYLVKAIKFPAAVRGEALHPVRSPFMATVTVSLLLLATAYAPIAPALASILWWIGAVAHLALTVFFMNRWSSGTEFVRVLPTWLVPLVGNVVAPLAGVHVGSIGLSWVMFGMGAGLWLALLPVIVARYVLHGQPQPAKLAPSIAIMIAPPAIIALSLDALVPGSLNSPIGFVIVGVATAYFLVFLANLPTLTKTPFGLPWWATTFPLAGFSTAVSAMSAFHSELIIPALILAVAVTVQIAVIAVRTLIAIAQRKICVPE